MAALGGLQPARCLLLVLFPLSHHEKDMLLTGQLKDEIHQPGFLHHLTQGLLYAPVQVSAVNISRLTCPVTMRNECYCCMPLRVFSYNYYDNKYLIQMALNYSLNFVEESKNLGSCED